MKTKIKKSAFVFSLVLILILSSTCKRNVIDEPSPLGPSSFAFLLNVSTSPNILSAGTSRETSTITATLRRYDGVAQENQTIVFGIYDANGIQVNVGYFEGNLSAVSTDTDSNGVASVTYYGPLATELTGSTTVYIWARVAEEGSEALSNSASVTIIQETTEITYSISANPNGLVAGTSRGSSTITATLVTADGTALQNQTILFEICDVDGNKLNAGFFTGNESVSTQTTNGNGVATVTYYGPLASEITANTTAYIRSAVAWERVETITESASINIIREVIEKTLNVSANPNMLNAGITRETSTITATLTTASGSPIANQTINFEICNELGTRINIGYFEGNQQISTQVTNTSGVATATYSGPLATELTGNTTIYIHASTALQGEGSLSDSVSIVIIQEARMLEVSANPNVIVAAGVARGTSTITASLKTRSGVPLAGQTIHFEIYDTDGNKVIIGYFDGNVQVASDDTDANGNATVNYNGPLNTEIAGNTTVYIRATLVSEGEEHIYESTPIYILFN